ncbi:hypothetical protein LOD99_14722 [Oopsacas minuta]|uniref:Uncharacterized protein n=1 Tax=Oopsacas minuta TaxID=111878 RepID=A0AAV7KC67_9METZ|nr:hypothetical protein LOD99_14722 [Oopsacas minuta]
MSHLPPRPPYLQDISKPLSYYRLVELPNHQFISYCAPSPRKHPNKLPTLRSKPDSKNKETQTPPAKLTNMNTDSLNKYKNYLKHRSTTSTASALPNRTAVKHQSSTNKRARSAYYERAKSGYVYWPTEPKPLTYDLKRPFGSVGAVLGLATGPR